MNEILCPLCNRPNPDNLQTCRFCGADLNRPPAPSDAPIRAGEGPVPRKTSEFEKVKLPEDDSIRPGDLPLPKDTGELEKALPSWLRSLRNAGEEESGAAFSEEPSSDQTAAAPTPEESADSLDWLARLQQEDEQEEIPDWMAGLQTTGAANLPPASQTSSAPPSAAEEEEEQNPQDWFTRLAPETPSSEQAAPAAESSRSEADIPDWLQTLKAAAEETPAASAGEAPEEEISAALPDWLETLKPVAEETPSAFKADGEVLDRLSSLPGVRDSADMASEQVFVPAETQESPPEAWQAPTETPEAEQTPDWLAALGGESDQGTSVSTEAVFRTNDAPPLASAVPDWLANFDANQMAAQAEQAEQSGETLPSWLSDIPGARESSGKSMALFDDGGQVTPEEQTGAFSLETPDWLARLGSDEPLAEPAEPVENTPDENIEIAELPSWVQAMKPVEAVVSDVKPASVQETGVTETRGPLAGLNGVLPGGVFTPSRKPPAYSIKLQVSDSQRKYATQLEKMILEEGQARKIRAVVLPSGRLWRWVISLVLLLAVFLPLISGAQLTPDLVLFPSEWERTHILVDNLPPNAPVLVVFDYEPAFAGEMQAAAAPLLDRILTRGARLTLVSTLPTGPALGEHFMQSTQAAHLQNGSQYVNLGYLPGGPSGIYYFASEPQQALPRGVDGSDAWFSPALQGVSHLSDFGALVVITDNSDIVRAWVEQTQTLIGETPLLMIVSAQAEPMARPYYDSGQVDGLVTGLTGGKTYEQTYGTQGLARRYWDAFGIGILGAILLILVGGMGNALLAWKDRKKVQSS